MGMRPCILFVDDEERVVNQLRIIFRQDYEVHTATSGAAALQILQSTQIDVVVSDQRMPGMTGIEFLAQVRRLQPSAMRLLLTGYSDLAAIVGSVNEGEVFRFINKPWDHAEIQATIASAVQAGSAARVAAVPNDQAVQDFMAQAAQRPQVLIIDDQRSDLDAIAQLLGEDHACLTAESVKEAIDLLSRHDVGVLVTEARVGNSDVGHFLHLLKRHYPLINTVMLTRASDADLVIRLINTSQIFALPPSRCARACCNWPCLRR
jgi:serine/threonine-protein kinase